MLKVNVDTGNNIEETSKKVAAANKKKEIPTLEESWIKILGMKNSKKDAERLRKVKELMEEGLMGREEDKLNKAFTKAEAMRLYRGYQDIMRKQRLDELADKELDKFPLIDTIPKLQNFVEGSFKADGMDSLEIERLVSMDTETVGDKGGTDKYSEEIAGFSMTYYIDGEEFNGYVPIHHRVEVSEGVWEPDPRNIDEAAAFGAIRSVFASGVDTVWHNATFDLGLIWTQLGVEPVGDVHDTLIIMHLLDEELMSYALKKLATDYLKIESETFEEMFGKDAKFADVPLSIGRWYAAKDTWIGYKLLEWQADILSKENFAKIRKAYLKIEMPCIRTTFHMERVGFVMDMEEVSKQHGECTEEIAKLDTMLKERFGEVNFGSPAQLQKMLYFDNDWSKYVTSNHKSILEGHEEFDEYGISNNGKFSMSNSGAITLDPVREFVADQKTYVIKPRNDHNKLSADSKALEKIAQHAPEVKMLVDLRELTKHLTAFVDKLPEMVSPDGRLHGGFKQSHTVTLRYASASPNLQQIPYKARRMFRVPENKVIISADFSAQEPRLAAHMSGSKDLITLYKEDRDLYSETASSIFNKPLKECLDGSKYRKQTKVVVLAVLFGMSSHTLGENLGMSKEEAQGLIDGFYSTYPEMKRWIKGNEKFVAKHRYVETMWGTRRRFKNVNFNQRFKPWGSMSIEERKEKSNLNRALRQSTNALVQGGAAMQTKQVMVALEQTLFDMNDTRGDNNAFALLATIHDEMLIEAPKNVTEEEVECIRDAMVNTVKLVVPSKTDIAIGTCWGIMVSDEEWFA